MVFGEMNAGTVACANTPATLMLLPNNAHKRTAAYVDDHAQGAKNFDDLLQGYRDFLDLCQQKNWTLNATKTKVGYPSCVFFGFEVDLHGTRLADKNLDPVRRMVPPSNLPELRSTLGVFVQSSRFIPRYSHIVAPLTALTRSAHGKPVPFVWETAQQTAVDHVREMGAEAVVELLRELAPAALQLAVPRPFLRPERGLMRHAKDAHAAALFLGEGSGGGAGGGDLMAQRDLRFGQHGDRSFRATQDVWRVQHAEVKDAHAAYASKRAGARARTRL
jgi:hypothetical protein